MLEALFRDVVEAALKNEKLRQVLEKLPAKTAAAIKSSDVSMSAVNKALKHKPFQQAAWGALGIDPQVVFPTLSGDTIYGDLSASIHSPALSEVYVSSTASKEVQDFFRAISSRFKPSKDVTVYDAGVAELGASVFPFRLNGADRLGSVGGGGEA